ncbi:MAG: hypothetical protein WC996_03485 [Peptostreptococcales bacterium]
MSKVKKATFKDLIVKKIQKEESITKVKDIYVSSMNATLTFKKPKDDFILNAIDEMGDMKSTRVIVEVYEKLIYHCCEMLQDPELHKELEVVDPLDTVNALFDLQDKMEIGEQLMDFFDLNQRNEEVKNL